MKKTSLFLIIMAFTFNGISLSAQVQTGVFRTPAGEMKEKGIDMADMQVKLLQKVEELTLYAIQQQKEIEELKRLLKEKK